MKKLFLIIIISLFVSFSVSGAIIFETNFEGADWTHQQPTSVTATCLSGCDIPNDFDAYFDGMSYCGSVGNNTFYMDTGAGHPSTTVDCKDGNKCLTFWDEGCTSAFEDSDGNIGIYFDEVYEIYVSFWIRFRSNYTFTDDRQHKLFHLQYSNVGTPWNYFSTTANNFPLVVGGLYRYSTSNYANYSCRGTVMSDGYARLNIGSPSYSAQFNNDFDGVNIGTHDAVYRDNQWHHFEYRFKVNTSASGDTYNSDGIIQFWYDGVLKQSLTTIPWNKNNTGYGRRGWKFFSIGGNNNMQVSGEQWYAIDGLVLSTTYVGPEYEITGGDVVSPSITISTSDPSSISTNSLSITGSASDNVGVSGVKWRIGTQPTPSTGTACSGTTTWSSTVTGFSSGANTLYVGAYDAAGNWGYDSITVNYITSTCSDGIQNGDETGIDCGGSCLPCSNSAPEGVINTPSQNQVIEVGDSVYFTGTGTDINGDNMTCLWNFDGGATNSILQDPGNIQFNTEGVYDVSFTVKDEHNLSDPSPDVVTITVGEVERPDVVIKGGNCYGCQ